MTEMFVGDIEKRRGRHRVARGNPKVRHRAAWCHKGCRTDPPGCRSRSSAIAGTRAISITSNNSSAPVPISAWIAFGLDTILSFGERLNTVAQMCRRAHAESIVFSHDPNCFFHWAPRVFVTADPPRWHDRHIHDDMIPALRQRGVTDEQIHTMLVENPRKYFEKQGAY